MPIELSDLPNAVADYLDTHVSVEVSEISSGNSIEHDEFGTYSVTVTNAGPPDGVRLVNVRYHLTISPKSVAKLVADTSALAPQRKTINPNDPTLANGELTDVMFIFPVPGFTDQAELDVGETTTFENLEVKGLRPGNATITCHIHADIDENDLFPKSENSPTAEVTFDVT
jgi:hypothetical protein